MIVLSASLHDSLKQWLVELGERAEDAKGNAKYEAYSGDSEPIDIRYGKKHIEYNPDVVWNNKGKLYIMEVAFSENWRSIVGEIALASMIKHSKLLLITQGFENTLSTIWFLCLERSLRLNGFITILKKRQIWT